MKKLEVDWKLSFSRRVEDRFKMMGGKDVASWISFELLKMGVGHRFCRGWIKDVGCLYSVEWWWCELDDGGMVDFCCRDLFGGRKDMPYGFFDRFDFIGSVFYMREEVWACSPYEVDGDGDEMIKSLYK